MNRADFIRLALIRLEEAQILLSKKKFSGAYYLAGYAVKCALKACIARRTHRFDFPPKPKYLWDNVYTHSLEKLLDATEFHAEFKGELEKSAELERNWNIVKDWTEESRYESRGRAEATDILAAISDREYGVLQWIKRHW